MSPDAGTIGLLIGAHRLQASGLRPRVQQIGDLGSDHDQARVAAVTGAECRCCLR